VGLTTVKAWSEVSVSPSSRPLGSPSLRIVRQAVHTRCDFHRCSTKQIFAALYSRNSGASNTLIEESVIAPDDFFSRRQHMSQGDVAWVTLDPHILSPRFLPGCIQRLPGADGRPTATCRCPSPSASSPNPCHSARCAWLWMRTTSGVSDAESSARKPRPHEGRRITGHRRTLLAADLRNCVVGQICQKRPQWIPAEFE